MLYCTVSLFASKTFNFLVLYNYGQNDAGAISLSVYTPKTIWHKLFLCSCLLIVCLICLCTICSFSTLILLVGSFNRKNRPPYNLYCVGGDVKHCSIQSNLTQADSNKYHVSCNLYWLFVVALLDYSCYARKIIENSPSYVTLFWPTVYYICQYYLHEKHMQIITPYLS